jgi:hypothetical protein
MAFVNPAPFAPRVVGPNNPLPHPQFQNMGAGGGGWSPGQTSGGGYQGGGGAFSTRLPQNFAMPQLGQPQGQQPRQQQQPPTPYNLGGYPGQPYGVAGGSQGPQQPQGQQQPQTAPPTAYNNPGGLRPTFPGYQPITPQTYNQQFGAAGAQRSASAPNQILNIPGQQGGSQSPGQTTANITSAYGSPVLPFADPNLNAQTVNRQFESSLGNQGLQSILNSMRPQNNGMAPTAGDQQMLTPFMTQQGTAGADALAGVPYAQGLGNANSLLGWQSGQAGDVLGQFNNLLGVNNAQQGYGLSNLLNQMNYGTGQLGNQLGFGQNILGTLAGPGSILSNLLGGLTGSVGNLAGGMIGLA